MVIAVSLLLVLANPQTTEIRTEIQVEATRPPDRRAELAGEISQLLYWTQVLMISRGIDLNDVYRKL